MPEKQSPTYNSWRGMLNRCRNKSHVRYDRYGGRGIRVCARWYVFANFLADMGERPKGLTLDRVDNDGDYEPGNCRWAAAPVQRRNGERVVMVTHKGKTQCVDDWAAELGVHRTTFRSRAEARDGDYVAAIRSFGG